MAGGASWEGLARAMEVVRSTASRRGKIAHLSHYLATLEDEDLRRACTFLGGRAFPAGDPRTPEIGWSTITAVLRDLTGADDQTIADTYLRWGDLGDVAQELLGRRHPDPLFVDSALGASLTLEEVEAGLVTAATASGKGSRAVKQDVLRHLLQRTTPLGAKYLVRVLTGDVRIGLREGLLEEAIGATFGARPSDVRRALLLQADPGAVALLARRNRLQTARLELFRPFRFMLAQEIQGPEEAFGQGHGTWLAEDKYDGIRVQVHRAGDRVAIYSRTLDDVTSSFPELTEPLRHLAPVYIADGEVVAWKGDRALPFHRLQQRLRRRTPGSLLEEIPVVLFLFDLLRLLDQDLLDRPLAERRASLLRLDFSERVRPVHAEEVADAQSVRRRFQEARERGNEGLVLKRLGAPYQPGRRGRLWLKLKEELGTLDVVVVAAEHGHGKRADVLSDYTFAVRDGDRLRVVGKAYSGLTDQEIADLTRWFRAHTLYDSGRVKVVEPRIVLEVAFNAITRSDRHDSGYALRFPRIKRIRYDKTPEEINTLADVETLYRAQKWPRFSSDAR